ncbi:MAG: hypothetical protein AAF901_04215 [Bacteroidota bacterium]
MTLKEGIKIHSQLADFESRLELSNGTISASLNTHTLNTHFDDAFVPQEPWRSPTQEEIDLIAGSYPSRNSNLELSIIKIPEEIIDGFRQVNYALIQENGLSDEMHDSIEYQQLFQRLTDHLKVYGKPEDMKVYGFTKGLPDLTTTSHEFKGKRYIGLHLDNWDGLSIDKRHLATNRISINVGTQERYFLYINLTAQFMYQMLKDDKTETDNISEGRFVGDHFMEKFPEYPVIKCKVNPGEAYIANTENIIHDGCTIGTGKTDYTFVVRGYFGL